MTWFKLRFRKEAQDPLLREWKRLQTAVPADIERLEKEVGAFAKNTRGNSVDPLDHIGGNYVADMTAALMTDIRLRVAQKSIELVPTAWKTATDRFSAGDLQGAVDAGRQAKELAALTLQELLSRNTLVP
jgi:hypothetical protein